MPLSLLLSAFLLLHILPRAAAAAGTWSLLLPSIGISAMHMQLLNTDTVVIFDRTDFGPSNISLPSGNCRPTTADCTAHSVEYSVPSNSVRPLTVLTDTWCSSGAAAPSGDLLQSGGYNDGDRAVRTFSPCRNTSCDWIENPRALSRRRWYATNHPLPGGGAAGKMIVIGGRREFSYEFFPKTSTAENGARGLRFLVETNDPGGVENNLYPFVFLNTDGNLFIFANNRAVLFDYVNGSVLRTYPVIPGGDPRNYPSSGSAVLLPLRGSNNGAEVLVCGGARKGSYVAANNRTFVRALDTCGRLRINEANPRWEMEKMPRARVMGDMVLLPNGNVLIVNGAGSGTAGWGLGREPVLEPVIYRPDNAVGSRFEVQTASSIPRMYHSTAVLLRDGRVLVGGSNPHAFYNFTRVLFPTELSLEAFSPSYLDRKSANDRPLIVFPASHARIGYRQRMTVRFNVPSGGRVNGSRVAVTMIAPPFTTHSFSMSQRLLILSGGDVTLIGRTYQTQVVTPDSGNFAPPGFYLLFVVLRDVPSEGIWVQIK